MKRFKAIVMIGARRQDITVDADNIFDARRILYHQYGKNNVGIVSEDYEFKRQQEKLIERQKSAQREMERKLKRQQENAEEQRRELERLQRTGHQGSAYNVISDNLREQPTDNDDENDEPTPSSYREMIQNIRHRIENTKNTDEISIEAQNISTQYSAINTNLNDRHKKSQIIIGDNINDENCEIKPTFELSASRYHGLITGFNDQNISQVAIQLIEQFSNAGVPVIASNIRGRFSGFIQNSESSEKKSEMKWRPFQLWDLTGKSGIPLRLTILALGPELLGHMLALKPSDKNALSTLYRVADDIGLLIIDSVDLHIMINFSLENRKEIEQDLGGLELDKSWKLILQKLEDCRSKFTEQIFGEPALDISDMLRINNDGRGFINLIESDGLIDSPRVFSTLMLSLLCDLESISNQFPAEQSVNMVIFIDQAHLVFNSLSAELLVQLEQLLKSLTTKGVAVILMTNDIRKIPDNIASILSNKIFLAMNDPRIASASGAFLRENKSFNTEDALLDLGNNEAMVSCVNEHGALGIPQLISLRSSEFSKTPMNKSALHGFLKSSDLISKYQWIERKDPTNISPKESAHENSNKQPTGTGLAAAVEGILGAIFSRDNEEH
jgi:hypothetical protein